MDKEENSTPPPSLPPPQNSTLPPPLPPPQSSTPPPPLPPPPQTSAVIDQAVPLPNSEPNNEDDAKYAEKVKNFTELILKSAEKAYPSKPLSPEFKTLLGKRIEENFHQLMRTPDHPPYQIMIRDAIISMNEDKGSTAEDISQFIRKDYPDLPYAHNVLFQHYLEQLWESGVVAEAGDRFFMRKPEVNPSASLAIVCRDESSLSPSTSISSSSSWDSSASSDTSFSNATSSKRRRCMPLKTRQRERTFLTGVMTRQGSVARKASGKQIVVREPELSLVPKRKEGKGKKAKNVKPSVYERRNKRKVGNEVDPNANILMLEGPGGSEEPAGGRDGCRHAVLACHDPITGKRRTLIDIDLDELEDLVNDDDSMEMEGSPEKGKNVAEDVDEKPLSDFVVYRKRGSSGMEQDLNAKASETRKGKDEEENGKLKKRTV